MPTVNGQLTLQPLCSCYCVTYMAHAWQPSCTCIQPPFACVTHLTLLLPLLLPLLLLPLPLPCPTYNPHLPTHHTNTPAPTTCTSAT
jgi:hypothetical protein